ncbi:MAG TPA: ROK family transcriptional regulator [Chloroflexia bacterium]|nr:ROK family transcriptional regulator [Chloroflexia bacterium]
MLGGTNLPRVRDYNQGVVLEAIRVGDGASRVEIAEKTGLTAQTVSNIVRRLLDQALVVEAGSDPSGRKPRVKLRINPQAGYAIGALIDRDETSLVLMALDGTIVTRTRSAVDQSLGAQGVITQLANQVEWLVNESDIPRTKILGMGIGCPGAMDHERGIVYEPLNLFGWNWREVRLKEELVERTGFPVIVDNDATAAAIGERWVGGAQGVPNFAFVFMGMGVGAGLYIENQIYRGDTTNAGELGHITLNMDGPLCFCGNRGCVEVYCAPESMVKEARNRLQAGAESSLKHSYGNNADIEVDIEMLSKAALACDPLALEVVTGSARMLAAGITSLVSLLDLRLVVLGGKRLHRLGSIYQSEVQRALDARLITRNIRQVRVELSQAGEDAGAVGAAAMVLHEIYSPRLSELNLV